MSRRRPLPRLPLAALLLTAACARPSDRLVVGAIGAWGTPDGALARRGAELAASELNGSGGLDGRMLELRFVEDQGTAAGAALAADSLARDARVVAALGPLSSHALLAAAPAFAASGLPVLATAPVAASSAEGAPWLFRLAPGDSAVGTAMARFAASLARPRAAVLFENDAFGRGVADRIRRAYGGALVSADPVGDGGAGAEPHLAWFKAQQVDLVLVASGGATGLALVREAQAAKLSMTFVGTDGWSGLAGSEGAEGAYAAVPFLASDPRSAAQAFVGAYRRRFGEPPDHRAALAYDAVRVAAAGLRAVGGDRRRLLGWLAGGHPVEGATGVITLGASGTAPGRGVRIARIAGGTLAPADGT